MLKGLKTQEQNDTRQDIKQMKTTLQHHHKGSKFFLLRVNHLNKDSYNKEKHFSCTRVAHVFKVLKYSQTSMARTSLGPWNFVRDMGSSSH